MRTTMGLRIYIKYEIQQTTHRFDSLVLGALGCGAFRNPPSHISHLFHEVMEEKEFKNKYRLLLFAILDDHNAKLSIIRMGISCRL